MRPGRRYFGISHCGCGARASVAAVCDCVIPHMHHAQIIGGEERGCERGEDSKESERKDLLHRRMEIWIFFKKDMGKSTEDSRSVRCVT